eukprot:TRINITY_DN49437_c0_g1_i1.p1 TRINITY_DN49437_c0_g1~~TRINITY_DN49437_c0_g1_i1.p1  ORF type:complete len:682 (-),score=341.47 TRINITY_DN49437_c0_g1_i1:159-2204(-)
MSWPALDHCVGAGAAAAVDTLVAEGFKRGQAIQAYTVAVMGSKKDAGSDAALDAARAYLDVYKQPHGEERMEVSMIEQRHRDEIGSTLHEFILAETTEEDMSAPGTSYDMDRLVDPAQLLEFNADDGSYVTAFDKAKELTDGVDDANEQLCVLFDFVYNHVTYTKNRVQYEVGNYWASAAETYQSRKGDCINKALLFVALCEGMGFTGRIVCVPGHGFANILVDPAWFSPATIIAWMKAHKKTMARGLNIWASDSGRLWVQADLSMSSHFGGRMWDFESIENVEYEPVLFGYPRDWVINKRVTFRYASDIGTRFEYAHLSDIEGDYERLAGIVWTEESKHDSVEPAKLVQYAAEQRAALRFGGDDDVGDEVKCDVVPEDALEDVAEYEFMWNTEGTKMRHACSIWRPKKLKPTHVVLGDRIVEGIDAPKDPVKVLNTEKLPKDAVAPPTAYKQVWTDQGTRSKHWGSLWMPIAPPGYAALGCVVSQSNKYEPPSKDAVVCVRCEFVKSDALMSLSWTDKGGGGRYDCSIYTIGNDFRTFVARRDYLEPGAGWRRQLTPGFLSATEPGADGNGVIKAEVTTTSDKSGSVSSYEIEFQLLKNGTIAPDKGGAHVKDKVVAISGQWTPKSIEWVEAHLAAGTYQNNYQYSAAVTAENGAAHRTLHGTYTSVTGNWTGKFSIKFQ